MLVMRRVLLCSVITGMLCPALGSAQSRAQAPMDRDAVAPLRLDALLRLATTPDDLHVFAGMIDYPQKARLAQRQGLVLATLRIDTAGVVTRMTTTTRAEPQFEKSVRAALPRVLFEPALDSAGRPVPTQVHLIVQFLFSGDPPRADVRITRYAGADFATPDVALRLMHMRPGGADSNSASARSSGRSRLRTLVPEMPHSTWGIDTAERGDAAGTSFSVDGEVRQPDGRPARPPEYDDAELRARTRLPEEALRQRVQGTVHVRAVVGASGAVSETLVERSDSPLLDEAARALVAATRFTHSGTVVVPVVFRLP